MSRAHRAQPSKDLILPFFFFSIITFASPSRTTLQERQTHGIPYFFNRYTFVSETSSVTNRCITLSLYPSLTSGPCVQFILLHRTEYSVSFSLTSLVMLFFEHMHYFFGTRSTRCIILNKATLAIFTRATLRAPLRIPPCCHLRRYSHRLAVAEAILRSLFVTPPER